MKQTLKVIAIVAAALIVIAGAYKGFQVAGNPVGAIAQVVTSAYQATEDFFVSSFDGMVDFFTK